MKFKFRIRSAVTIPMTIKELPFGQGISVGSTSLIITSNALAALQISAQNTIGNMDSLTLGFFDPYRLKEIST